MGIAHNIISGIQDGMPETAALRRLAAVRPSLTLALTHAEACPRLLRILCPPGGPKNLAPVRALGRAGGGSPGPGPRFWSKAICFLDSPYDSGGDRSIRSTIAHCFEWFVRGSPIAEVKTVILLQQEKPSALLPRRVGREHHTTTKQFRSDEVKLWTLTLSS